MGFDRRDFDLVVFADQFHVGVRRHGPAAKLAMRWSVIAEFVGIVGQPASVMRGDHRRCQAEKPLIVLCRFPEPALTAGTGAKASRCGVGASITRALSPMCEAARTGSYGVSSGALIASCLTRWLGSAAMRK
jgi:hypothetical protein